MVTESLGCFGPFPLSLRICYIVGTHMQKICHSWLAAIKL